VKNLKLNNRLFVAMSGVVCPVMLCSGLTSLLWLIQKTQNIYFPPEYPIIGSYAVHDWIAPVLIMAFIIGLFPIYVFIAFPIKTYYMIAQVISIWLLLIGMGYFMFIKNGILSDLFTTAIPFFMLGFFFSISILGAANLGPPSKNGNLGINI